MNIYSKTVMDHFQNPRNVGMIENADGVGEFGDPECGDFLRVFVKVEKNTIADVKYQIRGCPASIACASAMTELTIGKNLDDAMMITDDDIVNALDGLPEFKVHCSALGATGLQKALVDYFQKYVSKDGMERDIAGSLSGDL
ncbi:MAG: iron-sulfur cluster assembly scaffold protein [Syntrophus sp. (in: bacteria)]|nr:iron-sulfur cluster assembly scaffold protein [Syntrophus sp. (in: bacteria)]